MDYKGLVALKIIVAFASLKISHLHNSSDPNWNVDKLLNRHILSFLLLVVIKDVWEVL